MVSSTIAKKYNNIVQDFKFFKELRQSNIKIKTNKIDNVLEKYMLILLSIFIISSFWSLRFLIWLLIISIWSLFLNTKYKYLSIWFDLWYKQALCKKYNINWKELDKIINIIILTHNQHYEYIKDSNTIPSIFKTEIDELLS